MITSRRHMTQQQAMTELGAVLENETARKKRAADEYAAKWTTEKRRQAQKDGNAIPGPDGVGRFPIKDQQDVHNAHGLMGNSPIPNPTIIAHIRRMTKKHGLKLPAALAS